MFGDIMQCLILFASVTPSPEVQTFAGIYYYLKSPFSSSLYTPNLSQSATSISVTLLWNSCFIKCRLLYHTQGGLNNSLYLRVLGAESPRLRYWQILFLVSALFLAYGQLPSHCFHIEERISSSLLLL